ncbi:50S ribosomal protein L23 [Cephaloticoccus primus]|uniref:Large ribosomal subunit protein uL23 n=1 Tax=Cephaloticoccus primus TaxID=1548207 RepID=A0A139SKM6_9BACT|nr:50S ribosomal protein L23 [Cephaloticoccus primus]KXU35108.1 50S ribosomal protein L23 [Cephaloticoccus primus]
MNPNAVLKLARMTEKSSKQSAELGQYTFEVYPGTNKHSIAEAVEQAFKVSVRRVNIQNYRGKNKRTRNGRHVQGSDYKKAIVTLKTGDKIELI